ncbi:hypothetical protein HY030_01305 [Candidatus Gottesmanbacteria bacterium]|nr:hypothetical protein [Candidatus Gottesmanbacteria bacterium]
MKNFLAIITLILTTAAVSAGFVFWYLSPKFPKYPNSPSKQTAATSISQTNRFLPGMEKLNNLYSNYSEIVFGSYIVVELKGQVKSIRANSLLLFAKTQELSLPLTNEQIHYYRSKNETEVPKLINTSDIITGDTVKIQYRINPSDGKTSVSSVIKIN